MFAEEIEAIKLAIGAAEIAPEQMDAAYIALEKLCSLVGVDAKVHSEMWHP